MNNGVNAWVLRYSGDGLGYTSSIRKIQMIEVLDSRRQKGACLEYSMQVTRCSGLLGLRCELSIWMLKYSSTWALGYLSTREVAPTIFQASRRLKCWRCSTVDRECILGWRCSVTGRCTSQVFGVGNRVLRRYP